jgi:hypothetical protein
MTSRAPKKRFYKDNTDSELSLSENISSIEDIKRETSKWTRYDRESLNIHFKDSDSIVEIFNFPDDDLYLPGWNTSRFLNLTSADLAELRGKGVRQIITIIRKISEIVITERANTTKEGNTDSSQNEVGGIGIDNTNNFFQLPRYHSEAFMFSLLSYLEFDFDPLSIYPQYRYAESVNNFRISSIVEYMIMQSYDSGRHLVLFVEDKHKKNVSELKDWEEPQIAGEMFTSAHHNGSLSLGDTVKYPFDIFAVRVVGTRFTFYKATITREYLEECQNEGLPIRTKLVIERHPRESNPYKNAWNFCEYEDRIKIITMLKSIERKSIET